MNRSVPTIVAAAALTGACGLCSAQLTRPQVNVARYRFATGAGIDGHDGALAVDGKIGPRNRLLTADRGRQSFNMFFDEPTEIASFHIYSGLYDAPPLSSFTIEYHDAQGVVQPVPGGSVSGNTDAALNLILPSPIVVSRLTFRFNDRQVDLAEVAAFGPNPASAGTELGYPIGTGIQINQAWAHRLAVTEASSTASGSTRRAAVDGYVGSRDVWRSGTGPHLFSLDMADPDETDPVTIRVANTPVHVAGLHIYSGDAAMSGIPSRGRVQQFDDAFGGWVTIPNTQFAGNTDADFEILFDQPVVNSRFRLSIDDSDPIVLREVVLLPPGASWSIGTGVVQGDRLDYLDFETSYYRLVSDSGLAVTSDTSGVALDSSHGDESQQFQVIAQLLDGTHRIRNRDTGMTLAADRSTGALVQTVFSSMPNEAWELVPEGNGYRLVNAFTGDVLAESNGQLVLEAQSASSDQVFSIAFEADYPKKGLGSTTSTFDPMEITDQLQPNWAYNWGPNDSYPDAVNYWPMQWGSFNWNTAHSLVPGRAKESEPVILMGFNEPDRPDQANIPVSTAIEMWPRNEAQGFPLLSPVTANLNPPWFQDFTAEALDREYLFDYTGVHWYGRPQQMGGFISRIQQAYNMLGKPVVVSEFSISLFGNQVNDPSQNNFDDNDTYRFFLEALWRLEEMDIVERYAIFPFVDEPGNPVSANRGEVRFEDGTLTPEGRLYGAWDGDLTIRTDTPYYLHNRGNKVRFGADQNEPLKLGDRDDHTIDFEWMLEPATHAGAQPGEVYIRSVVDGRLLSAAGSDPAIVSGSQGSADTAFTFREVEHGWFLIEDAAGRPLRIDP
ncbi:MAG: glycosyl hydrolase, partial [Planctomycetota bacterium]